MMQSYIRKAEKSHILTKDELVSLLSDDTVNGALFAAAHRVRLANVGDAVFLRGLIEFSNFCRNHCLYCGLRAENMQASRYRQKPEEIVGLADYAKSCGIETVVLQSGEDLTFSADTLCDIISRIKKNDMAVTLSLGERSSEEYAAFKKAGADRYLLRIETTDKALYKAMHPKQSLANRKRCLLDLKVLGFEVGTGSLIGLPNQTPQILADDLLFYQELDADMVGIGPFVPHSCTPLADKTAGSVVTTQKMVALTRLLLPLVNIPATTAVETLNKGVRADFLQSGANVIMPNVNFAVNKEKYEIYPEKYGIKETLPQSLEQIRKDVIKAGQKIGEGKGNSLNHKKAKIIGLTGGIACGKSTAAKMLADMKFPVIDCDKLVKSEQQNNPELIKLLKKEFPAAFTNGKPDRKKLSDMALLSAEALKKIEDLTVPFVISAAKKQVLDYQKQQVPLVVLDAPLLFERHFEWICDRVVCLYVPEDIQQERYLMRPNASLVKFNIINAAQMPLEEKIKRSDYAILSDTMENLEAQLKMVIANEALNNNGNRVKTNAR